jgi:dTDP-4-amino-4,6-dideoxy-D-galactose acyltransferase
MGDLIEPLPWDTEFFGIPIGRVDLTGVDAERLRAIDAAARGAGFACLYGTLEPTDETAAYLVQTFGHRLVEVGITFERPAGPFTSGPGASKVRPGTLDDLPALEPAIRTMAPWSRFAADPRFGPDAALRMHRAWAERAARGTGERALYVAYDDTGVTGLGTFGRSPVPHIDIVGVTKPGTGAADALIRAMVEWAGGGHTEAGAAAARNIAVLRWLDRNGFRACRTRYVFHRWFDDGEAPR